MRVLLVVLVFAVTILAQASTADAPISATTQETAALKVLQDAETKAATALTAAREKLPEFKAAQEALRKLKEAEDRLPEKAAFTKANEATWDEAYRSLARHGLSSREYEPAWSAGGGLEFRKKPRQ